MPTNKRPYLRVVPVPKSKFSFGMDEDPIAALAQQFKGAALQITIQMTPTQLQTQYNGGEPLMTNANNNIVDLIWENEATPGNTPPRPIEYPLRFTTMGDGASVVKAFSHAYTKRANEGVIYTNDPRGLYFMRRGQRQYGRIIAGNTPVRAQTAIGARCLNLIEERQQQGWRRQREAESSHQTAARATRRQRREADQQETAELREASDELTRMMGEWQTRGSQGFGVIQSPLLVELSNRGDYKKINEIFGTNFGSRRRRNQFVTGPGGDRPQVSWKYSKDGNFGTISILDPSGQYITGDVTF